jgi:hypothetical protein
VALPETGCKCRENSEEKTRNSGERMLEEEGRDGKQTGEEVAIGMRRDAAGRGGRGKIKKALCGNRRPSNDCLPYEKSLKDRCCLVFQPHKDKN